jgi:glycosyltransferase involved in cell wall biosynthesis
MGSGHRTAPSRPAEPDRVTVRIGPEAFTKHVGGVRRTALEFVSALANHGVDVDLPDGVDGVEMTSDVPGVAHRLRMQMAEAAFHLRRSNRSRRGVHHALYYDAMMSSEHWPVVTTVYDMIHEVCGVGSHRLTVAKARAVRRAARVIAISESTAQDVRRLLDPKCEIEVIHLGVSEHLLSSTCETPPISHPYLLFVGSRSGYKNFALLAEAWMESSSLGDLHLVLAGGGPLDSNEQELLASPIKADRLRHIERVSDDVLAACYRNAAAVVVPSRYEGFGLPVVEAMAFGAPVASSTGGSLPEVSGGHSVLFAPDSVSECANAIEVALSKGQPERLAAQAHARRFTWQRTAETHAVMYRRLLNG